MAPPGSTFGAVAMDNKTAFSGVNLCPSQQKVVDEIRGLWDTWNVFGIQAERGMGLSTVLDYMQKHTGGVILRPYDLLKNQLRCTADKGMHGAWTGLVLSDLLDTALDVHDVIYIDDAGPMEDTHFNSPYYGSHEVAYRHFVEKANLLKKKVVFALNNSISSEGAEERTYLLKFKYDLDDFEFFLKLFLGTLSIEALSPKKVMRMGRNLSAARLKAICADFKKSDPNENPRTHAGFMKFLNDHGFASNVDLETVEKICFDDLLGCDDLIKELKRHVLFPFMHEDTASRLGMTPKKGILLTGRPGTGKTSLGRAMAHELKGRFFLIDGDFIAGQCNFYARVKNVIEAAKANAPSVLLVDDADVIFKSGQAEGLHRFLLTLLDGIENNQNADVCVMLTCMYPKDIPMSLLRSGRFDLWLQTRLPDDNTRRALLQAQIPKLPEDIRDIELDVLVKETEGLIQADFPRLTRETATFYALDLCRGKPMATSFPFTFVSPKKGDSVRLCSSHNDYDDIVMEKDESGQFFHTEFLEPGRYLYQYVVDGDVTLSKEEGKDKCKENNDTGDGDEVAIGAEKKPDCGQLERETKDGKEYLVLEISAHNPATCYMMKSVNSVHSAIRKKQTTWQLQEQALNKEGSDDGYESE